jgi:hypothetical protein
MAEREPPGYPYGGPAGALPVFGRGLNVKADYLEKWVTVIEDGWMGGTALTLRGARGSAARFPAMTSVRGPYL